MGEYSSVAACHGHFIAYHASVMLRDRCPAPFVLTFVALGGYLFFRPFPPENDAGYDRGVPLFPSGSSILGAQEASPRTDVYNKKNTDLNRMNTPMGYEHNEQR